MSRILETRVPQVQFRTIDGVRVRYADSGASWGPTVVLTSPLAEERLGPRSVANAAATPDRRRARNVRH
jgi:hypothetical protein